MMIRLMLAIAALFVWAFCLVGYTKPTLIITCVFALALLAYGTYVQVGWW